MVFDRRELIKGDPAVGLRVALQSFQQTVWTALPAIVTAYDPNKMTIQAQPTVQARVSDALGNKAWVNLPICQDVPVVFPQAGGFALTFPIAEGDEVLLVFASRCIDAWWQNGGIGVQAELRMHDLSDGFAFLGPCSQPKVIPGVSTRNVELRARDHGGYVAITPELEVIVHGLDVTIEASVNRVAIVAGATVDITAPSVVVHADSVTINAALTTINGHVDINGTANVTGELTARGINVSEHDHGGIVRGSARTDPPHNLIP